ncbi:MAG: hypothetical protein KAT00_14835 [Planctomycetes bacterium]|nr:hypothetical protein [Planctomycetota bacterium]
MEFAPEESAGREEIVDVDFDIVEALLVEEKEWGVDETPMVPHARGEEDLGLVQLGLERGVPESPRENVVDLQVVTAWSWPVRLLIERVLGSEESRTFADLSHSKPSKSQVTFAKPP